VSGGLGDVQHSVEVATEPALVAPALHQLNPATVGQKVHMPLDRPDRPVERLGQCRHLRPAQSALVVAVIAQSAVRWDDLSRDTGLDQVLNLRDTGEFRRHSAPLSCGGCHVRRGGCALVESMIESAKAAGSRFKGFRSAAFFYSVFNINTVTELAVRSRLTQHVV
jgi:hypothetical protein